MKKYKCLIKRTYVWTPVIEAENENELDEKLDKMFDDDQFMWENADDCYYETSFEEDDENDD